MNVNINSLNLPIRPSQPELAFKYRKINNKIQKKMYQVHVGTKAQQHGISIR